MPYRKLRIAWSVAWGVVAVLLIALWVRSTDTFDDVGWGASFQGRLYVAPALRIDSIPGKASEGTVEELHPGYFTKRVLKIRNLKVSSLPSGGPIIPYWPLVLMMCAIIPVPWLRFSLRTLLIATTLVAVVLGLIVWLR